MSIPDLILRVIGKADGDTAHIDHDKFAHGDDEYQGLFEAIASYFGKRGKSRGSQAVAQRCLTIAGKYGTSGWFGTARREPR